jgi:glycosyltransferase involved in cell wall biosynthesis
MPHHYLASGGGGAETQVELLIDIINKKKNYDVHFLCRRVPCFNVESQQIWKIGSDDGLGKLWTFIDTKRIYSLLKKIKPQIIYQNVGCAYTGVAAFYARKNNAKLIWHIASDLDLKPELEDDLKRRLVKLIDRIFLDYGIRNAHCIVGQTRYQEKLLKRRFGRECHAFIPIGHPLPEQVSKKVDKITVLWIANMKPLKQPEIFVKMAKVIGKLPNVDFIMMGYPYPGKWFSGILNEISSVPNLKYLGFLPQKEVNRRLSEGHILVNTSRYEGFSNTFIQAWLRQVPVVSLNVDPDNSLVREGIGFYSQTFEHLCQDVSLLISDKGLRSEMGCKAQQYSFKNHSIDKMASTLISIFDRL